MLGFVYLIARICPRCFQGGCVIDMDGQFAVLYSLAARLWSSLVLLCLVTPSNGPWKPAASSGSFAWLSRAKMKMAMFSATFPPVFHVCDNLTDLLATSRNPRNTWKSRNK